MKRADFVAACATPPSPEQIDGVRLLARSPGAALFDDPGFGKTKQVVDAACLLASEGTIDTVVVVCPRGLLRTWVSPDPIVGQVAQHHWASIPYEARAFSSDARHAPRWPAPGTLAWLATNYDWFRREDNIATLIAACRGRRVAFVVDESWAVKSHASAQTKACVAFRYTSAVVRAWLLNGTPSDESPLDVFGQALVMDRSIYGTSFVRFRAKYAVMGGFRGKQVLDYQSLDDLGRRLAPYVLRRTLDDFTDVPATEVGPAIVAPLSPENWRRYKDMRDEAIAVLTRHDGTSATSLALHGGTELLRLSQITSGFLGGLDDDVRGRLAAPEIVGREKLDAVLAWYDDRPERDLKIIFWCRFRAELARLVDALRARGDTEVFPLHGDQDPREREALERRFALTDTTPGRHAIVGHVAAGGAGLNLAGAWITVFVSNTDSGRERTQALGRPRRRGQTRVTVVHDAIATGPTGQRTVDATRLAQLAKKRDLARVTGREWRVFLEEEKRAIF